MLPLLFDWDDGNVEHVGRHAVTPDEADDALLDPEPVGTPAYRVGGEARTAVIGSTASGRVLFVVTTRRRRRVREITAREATERDKRQYRRRSAE